MEWFIALVVGLVVGALAWGLFSSEKANTGVGDLVAGLIGGLVGKLFLSSAWVVGTFIIGTSFNLYSVLWAAIGAIVFVGLWRVLAAAQSPTSLPR